MAEEKETVNNKLCVVYITNGNTGDQGRLTWSLRSLVKYSKLSFDVIALSNERIVDLSQVVSGLQERGTYLNVMDMYETLVEAGIHRDRWNRSWPFEVLYRLGIPLHPAFDKYDRVLYLDTDTLVFSDRVDSFLSAPLDGFEIGGVIDTVQEEHNRILQVLNKDLRPEYADRLISVLGDQLFTNAYVNAGVLLWNLTEIRKDLPWYKERLSMFWEAETRGRVGFLDQDFVNVMMRVRYTFSLVFNWFNGCGRETDECVIRHYCGKQYEKMANRAVLDSLL